MKKYYIWKVKKLRTNWFFESINYLLVSSLIFIVIYMKTGGNKNYAVNLTILIDYLVIINNLGYMLMHYLGMKKIVNNGGGQVV